MKLDGVENHRNSDIEFLGHINPLNAELNPIRHLLALVGARHIVHVGRVRVNSLSWAKVNPVHKAT